MRCPNILLYIIGLHIIAGCTGARYLERTSDAEAAFHNKDYQEALSTTENIIARLPEKKSQEHGRVYVLAGNSAHFLGDYSKSRTYLEKARKLGYANEQMYLNLAENYQRIDNLSKEINVLEDYLHRYPEGMEIARVRNRLFQTCSESENYGLAENLWPLLEKDARSDETNLELYLEINRSLKNDSICDALAIQLLEQNENSEPALKWMAEKHYWKAENRYQAEMKAYSRNKTRKQYAGLLKAFKTVSEDFRESLEYFTRLYEISPKPEYANYLGNIYARLNDEQKARYYHDKAR